MAFLLCVGFCGYGVMRKVSSSVGCPLSGRYVYLYFKGLNVLGSCSLSLWQFVLVDSANLHCRPKFVSLSARKICQCSWVASLSGRGGWFLV